MWSSVASTLFVKKTVFFLTKLCCHLVKGLLTISVRAYICILIFVFFAMSHGLWYLSSLTTLQQWKRWVLTTRQLGNSLDFQFYSVLALCQLVLIFYCWWSLCLYFPFVRLSVLVFCVCLVICPFHLSVLLAYSCS